MFNKRKHQNKSEEIFLLKEYELIRDSKNQSRTFLHARFVVFISIYALFVSNIAHAFGENKGLSIIYLLLIIVLYIIGWSTYAALIEHNISITNYLRNLNQIRNYFVNKYEAIQKHIGQPIFDNFPPHGHFGFNRKNNFIGFSVIIAIINSFLLGVIPFLYFFIIKEYQSQISIDRFPVSSILASTILFIFSFIFHNNYKRNRFLQAEMDFKCKFPKDNQ